MVVLAVIALGGGLGALARYGIGYALPSPPTGFPWDVFAVNASGCLVIGAVTVFVGRIPGRRLVRPFLTVGVLGGYTTFSTYAVGVQRLVDADVPGTALAYLALTPVCAVAAVAAGDALARLVPRPRSRETRPARPEAPPVRTETR